MGATGVGGCASRALGYLLTLGWTERESKQEEGRQSKLKACSPVICSLPVGSIYRKVHSLSEQCHLLGTECSYTGVCAGHFTYKHM